MPTPAPAADRALPTRWQAALFRLKTTVFRARRLWREAMGGRPPWLRRDGSPAAGPVLAESRTPLYASELAAEFALQAGKVQNLRVAAGLLDGLRLGRGETFSFWRHVGRPTRRRGFAAGRELREGCIVPSVGGGLCQLSNALYATALDAGCEIVERHAHSRRVPGSAAEAGRDATVFWNYVDLRFRAPADCRLEVLITRRELVVRLRASAEAVVPIPVQTVPPPGQAASLPVAESCETCNVVACFRHPGRPDDAAGITAWLVDGWWPEFDRHLRARRRPEDWLFLPLEGRRWRLGAYRWTAESFAAVRTAPWETLGRSWRSRRLAAQGAARQRALLGFDAALATRYARGLPPAALHLVVSQTLLPHLWRGGALGGRTFDVLMTRLPLTALQATLDRTAARWPGSRTPADFRAPAALVEAETAALAAARRWITPHAEIARLAGGRAESLPWELPPPSPRGAPGRDVLFPASTLARKGAGELAAAARALGLRVQLAGPVLEDGDPWRGVNTLPARPGWAGVGALVLPAWVEHQPRRLLLAAAAGVPVVASAACGLEGVPGVTTVPADDPAALAEAISRCLPAKDSLTLPVPA